MSARYTKLAVIGALLLFSGAPFASASTIYQQLSDSSGEVGSLNTRLLGTFILATSTSLTANVETGLVVVNFHNLSLDSGISLTVGTDNTCASSLAHYDSMTFSSTTQTNTDSDFFADLTGKTTTVLSPGTYYICGQVLVNNATTITLRTNFSQDFVYGNLTGDGSGESVPIVPGLPGFTDVGIATSSQAAYCYQNFASSTGFLDSVGLSISQGFCNVGVFLFIPSQNSLNQFTALSGTLETKMPFSWFFDVRTLLAGAEASSTGNAASLSFTFGSTTTALKPITVDALSTSTISKYYPDSVRNAALFLMAVAFYMAGLTFIYLDISKHWQNRV